MSGIHVKIKGEAHTEWAESTQKEDSQGKTESTDTLHTGHEEYFQVSYYLLGSSTGMLLLLQCNVVNLNSVCCICIVNIMMSWVTVSLPLYLWMWCYYRSLNIKCIIITKFVVSSLNKRKNVSTYRFSSHWIWVNTHIL